MSPSRWLADGVAIVPGPYGATDLAGLQTAYDRVVAAADPADVRNGTTSIRVNILAGQPGFDSIYTHGPLLGAAAELIGDAFKLSAFHARTLKPRTPAEPLHQDFAPLPDGWPMVGFILAIDDFRAENGATRFLHGSQTMMVLDSEPEPAEVQSACAPAGAMIIFNGSVWHGHGANNTPQPRRSIQGALIRRDQRAAVDHAARLSAGALSRLGALERALLGGEDACDAPKLPLARQGG